MVQSLSKPVVFVIIEYTFAYDSQILFLHIQLRAVIVYAHKKLHMDVHRSFNHKSPKLEKYLSENEQKIVHIHN